MPALAGASPPSPENLVGAECLLRGKTREDKLLGELRKTPGAWSLYTYRRDSPSRVFPPRAGVNLVRAECLLRGKTREDELLGKLRKTPGAWSLYTYRRDSPSRVFPPRAFLKKGGGREGGISRDSCKPSSPSSPERFRLLSEKRLRKTLRTT